MTASSVTWALPLPVLIPLIFAGFTLILFRHPKLQQVIAVAAMTVATGFGVTLLIAAREAPVVLDVGSWAAPIGITLVADQLAAIMLVVSQVVSLAVLVYSVAQNVSSSTPSAPIAVFYPTFLILSAGVSNAFLTGDLFNLYVGFEILLAASFVLITLGGTRGRVRAGTVYVVVSLVSSTLFLTGIAWIYGATGTVNMAQLSERLPELPASSTLGMQLLLLVAFGVKAAVFPLGAWLPDSYPTAPAPVTAVFAGLLTKVGVYAIIRLEFVLFAGDPLGPLLGVLGILTMIMGILGAIAQDDAKRLLSFTLVSHIGFMLWGISLNSTAGLSASIYYAAHHIVVQTALFLMVGLIELRTGTTSLTKLSDLAKRAPLLSILFFITMLNLVGIPPLTGFVGKLGLAQSSVQAGTPLAWWLLAGGLVTSFLTLYVAVKFWNKAFWQPRGAEFADHLIPAQAGPLSGRQERSLRRLERALPPTRRAEKMVETAKTKVEKGRGPWNPLMYAVVIALVLVQISMAVFAGPIYQYTTQAAQFLRTPNAYADAVFAEGQRGEGSSLEESLPPLPLPWWPEEVLPPLLPKPTPDLPEVGGDAGE